MAYYLGNPYNHRPTTIVMKLSFAVTLLALLGLAACNNTTETKEATNTDATTTERPSISNNDELPAGAHRHGDNVVGVMGAGPNKGLLVHGNTGYHVEMVIDGNNLIFYPMDQEANAMDPNGWTGNAVVQQGNDTKTYELKARDGKMIAENVNPTNAFKAVVTLKKDDIVNTATINYDAATTHNADHSHEHGDDQSHNHGDHGHQH